MTQLVKVLSEAKRPPNEKQVLALLHDDSIPETRQIVLVIQAGFDAHDHIEASFAPLWETGLNVGDAWAEQTDIEDIEEKAADALAALNADIAIIDGTPTNADMIAIVRRTLMLHRKEIRVLRNLLTEPK